MNNPQVTLDDVIKNDPRSAEIIKGYQEADNTQKEVFINASYVEADLILTMGAFNYLNEFLEVEEARKELIERFKPLIMKKANLLDKTAELDEIKKKLKESYDKLAELIVSELKAKFEKAQKEAEAKKNDVECSCECQEEFDACADGTKPVPPEESEEIPGPETAR